MIKESERLPSQDEGVDIFGTVTLSSSTAANYPPSLGGVSPPGGFRGGRGGAMQSALHSNVQHRVRDLRSSSNASDQSSDDDYYGQQANSCYNDNIEDEDDECEERKEVFRMDKKKKARKEGAFAGSKHIMQEYNNAKK
jgi:hypothetical protein